MRHPAGHPGTAGTVGLVNAGGGSGGQEGQARVLPDPWEERGKYFRSQEGPGFLLVLS